MPTRPAKAVLSGLAVAGIIGPILFLVVFLAQDLLRGDYDPLAEGPTSGRVGPFGWVQSVNFVVLGLLMIAFAVGLHRGVRAARAGVAGPAIVAWVGVALVVAGAFPLREAAGGFGYEPNVVYGVNNSISFGLGLGLGLIVLSRRFTRDARWRDLATFALAIGVAVLVMSVSTSVLLEPGQSGYGLMRRATLAVWSLGIIVLALRLRRVAQAEV